MSMSEERRRTVRFWLDLGTTGAMIAAAIWISFVGYATRRVMARPATARVESPAPEAPVSIAGAALLGGSSARWVLLIYSDFQCPYCAKLARTALPAIRSKYVNTGRIALAFRHFPIASRHPYAMAAAEAAECAGSQGKFWPMHDALFASDDALDQSRIAAFAAGLDLDMSRYGQCVAGEMRQKVQQDLIDGMTLGVSGTPTMFLGVRQADGRVLLTDRLSGIRTSEEIAAVIEKRAHESSTR